MSQLLKFNFFHVCFISENLFFLLHLLFWSLAFGCTSPREKNLSKCCHSNAASRLFLCCTCSNCGYKMWLKDDLSCWVQTTLASGATLVPLRLEDRTLPELPLLGFTLYFLGMSMERQQLDFYHSTSCLWEEAVVVGISGAKTDLLESVGIIIWQQNTSSHITHAFAN